MNISPETPKKATLDELGRRLALYRKRRGFSQDELAKQAGIGVATLRRIEDGRDSQMGSWIKILFALNESAAIDSLLPENVKSPMQEMGVSRKNKSAAASNAFKTTSPPSRPLWGDEQ